jgi:small conductance mechanosensitive channel
LEKKDLEYGIYIIGILFGAFIVSEILRWIIKRLSSVKAEKLKVDPTHHSFLKNAISFVIYSIAFIHISYTIPSFKAFGGTLFAGAGIFAAIIALASQQAFSNIISGIFIVISKPFRVGDYIEISIIHKGTVEDITLRHTVIRDIQNNRIIVPNAKINSETIVNYHLNDERKNEKIEFVLDIETDIDKASKIMKEEISKHPEYIYVKNLQNKYDELVIQLTKIENGSLTLRALVGSEDPEKAYEMHCDINYSVKKRFDEAGIHFAKRINI